LNDTICQTKLYHVYNEVPSFLFFNGFHADLDYVGCVVSFASCVSHILAGIGGGSPKEIFLGSLCTFLANGFVRIGIRSTRNSANMF
jgi:hypothetical protein